MVDVLGESVSSPPTPTARCTRRTTSAGTAAPSSSRPSPGAAPQPVPRRRCAAPTTRGPTRLDGSLLRAPHAEGVDRSRLLAAPGGGGRVGRASSSCDLDPDRRPSGQAGAPLASTVERPDADAGQLRHRGAGHRADVELRGGGELEGGRRELQRVLPLRPGAPRAVPAGAGLRRRRRRPGLGQRGAAPRGCLDVHDDRDDDAGAAARAWTRPSGPTTRASWSTRT